MVKRWILNFFLSQKRGFDSCTKSFNFFFCIVLGFGVFILVKRTCDKLNAWQIKYSTRVHVFGTLVIISLITYLISKISHLLRRRSHALLTFFAMALQQIYSFFALPCDIYLFVFVVFHPLLHCLSLRYFLLFFFCLLFLFFRL